jgi:hypothetical protein
LQGGRGRALPSKLLKQGIQQGHVVLYEAQEVCLLPLEQSLRGDLINLGEDVGELGVQEIGEEVGLLHLEVLFESLGHLLELLFQLVGRLREEVALADALHDLILDPREPFTNQPLSLSKYVLCYLSDLGVDLLAQPLDAFDHGGLLLAQVLAEDDGLVVLRHVEWLHVLLEDPGLHLPLHALLLLPVPLL